MRHFASPSFWAAYEKLPAPVRDLADRNYALLKEENPQHPLVRVGLRYRALAVEVDEGALWFWIGSHADYDALIG